MQKDRYIQFYYNPMYDFWEAAAIVPGIYKGYSPDKILYLSIEDAERYAGPFPDKNKTNSRQLIRRWLDKVEFEYQVMLY